MRNWDLLKELDVCGLQAFRRPHWDWDDPGAQAVNWVPPVNVYEDKENMYVEAQMPGIDMKDVKLSVTDHTLLLQGERKCEHTDNDERYHFCEAQYGSFARNFRLPRYVKPDASAATYDKGVLTVKIPKVEQAKPILIPVGSK